MTVVPSGPYTVTVLPGSAIPVTWLPPAAKFALGASGAVVSGAVIVVLGLSWPAPFVTLTLTCSPLVSGGAIGTL